MKSKLKELLELLVEKIKNIYMIKISNTIIVIIGTILLYIAIKSLRDIVPNTFNIHLGIDDNISYLTIYSIIASLLIPLVILMAEKINKRKDYIIVLTYLKTTGLFPILIYFCTNICIFTLENDKYYFIITCIISIILVLTMAYQIFKLFSDPMDEDTKIATIRHEAILKVLKNRSYKKPNDKKLKNYMQNIIITEDSIPYDLTDYKKYSIFPETKFGKIKNYNYNLLDKIANKLKSASIIIKNNDNPKKFNMRPKIIVKLLKIGTIIEKDKSCIEVYCDKKRIIMFTRIKSLLSDKIYKIEETNYYNYVLSNYEYLHEECINAINMSSDRMLSKKLEKLLDIYRDYINVIKKELGDYSYSNTHDYENNISFLKFLDIFDEIQKDILFYYSLTIQKDNTYLMIEVESFLKKLLVYSNNQSELLSFLYFNSNYYYFIEVLKKSTKDDNCNRLISDFFHIMKRLKSSITSENWRYSQDALLTCNKTLGKILYEVKDINIFDIVVKKTIEFIKDMDNYWKSIKRNDTYINQIIKSVYEILISHFKGNLFAVLAYIVHSYENNNKDVNYLKNVYKDYSVDVLAEILTDDLGAKFNSVRYNWDLLDEHNDDEPWWSNTQNYLIHFLCLILDSKDNITFSANNTKNTYKLSIYADEIIKEFGKMNRGDLIDKFNKMLDDIKNNNRKYLQTSHISQDRIKEFKEEFKNQYVKNSELFLMFQKTRNVEQLKKNFQNMEALKLNTITSKEYFLATNFYNEDTSYSDAPFYLAIDLINKEYENYVNLIKEKSQISKEELFQYLTNENLNYNKYVMVGSYDGIYNFLPTVNIIYDTLEQDDKRSSSFRYFCYKNKKIPIYILDNLSNKYVYLFKKDELGKLKTADDIEINIIEITNSNVNDIKNKYIDLNIKKNEDMSFLLESVDIDIKKYCQFDTTNMKGLRFKK